MGTGLIAIAWEYQDLIIEKLISNKLITNIYNIEKFCAMKGHSLYYVGISDTENTQDGVYQPSYSVEYNDKTDEISLKEISKILEVSDLEYYKNIKQECENLKTEKTYLERIKYDLEKDIKELNIDVLVRKKHLARLGIKN